MDATPRGDAEQQGPKPGLSIIGFKEGRIEITLRAAVLVCVLTYIILITIQCKNHCIL